MQFTRRVFNLALEGESDGDGEVEDSEAFVQIETERESLKIFKVDLCQA